MDALCDTVPSAPAPFVSRTVALVKALDAVDAHSLLAENKALYGHRQALKLCVPFSLPHSLPGPPWYMCTVLMPFLRV